MELRFEMQRLGIELEEPEMQKAGLPILTGGNVQQNYITLRYKSGDSNFIRMVKLAKCVREQGKHIRCKELSLPRMLFAENIQNGNLLIRRIKDFRIGTDQIIERFDILYEILG